MSAALRLLELFFSFFQVGLFTFGGGYAAIPLIQDQVIRAHPWMTMAEFTDLVTIAEMTPGPIALNSATFVGTRIAGFPGAVAATLGAVLPSVIIVSLLAFLYFRYRRLSAVQEVLKGLRPAVVAMISCAGLAILNLALFGDRQAGQPGGGFDVISLACFLGGLFALRRWKLSPIAVMLGAGVLGAGAHLLFG